MKTFYQTCLSTKNIPKHLFISSFLAFLFLNIIENFIHYTSGKYHDSDTIQFELPSKKDVIKIIIVMFIFAILQGVFTLFLYKYT